MKISRTLRKLSAKTAFSPVACLGLGDVFGESGDSPITLTQEKGPISRVGKMLAHFSCYTPDPIRTGDLLLRRRSFYPYWTYSVRTRRKTAGKRPFLHIVHMACGKVV
jgi:hypothetical protein